MNSARLAAKLKDALEELQKGGNQMKTDAQGYPQGTKYFHKLGDNPYFADAIKPGDTRIPSDSYSVPREWDEYESILIAWEDQKTAQPAEIISEDAFYEDGHSIDCAVHSMAESRKTIYAARKAYHDGFKAGCKAGIFAESPQKNTEKAFDCGVIDAVLCRGSGRDEDCSELLGGV